MTKIEADYREGEGIDLDTPEVEKEVEPKRVYREDPVDDPVEDGGRRKDEP